jgi:hypothetical protein
MGRPEDLIWWRTLGVMMVFVREISKRHAESSRGGSIMLNSRQDVLKNSKIIENHIKNHYLS